MKAINHHLEGTQLVDSSASPNFLPPLTMGNGKWSKLKTEIEN